MNRLLIAALAVLGVAILAAPFVAGGLISRGRRRGALRVVAELQAAGRHRVREPFLPELPELRKPITVRRIAPAHEPMCNRYESLVQAAAETALEGIEAALAWFAAVSAQTYGDGYDPRVPARPVKACTSIDVAMIRLRCGVLEPAFAYRPGETDTSTWDVAGLRALFAAEDLAAAAA